MPDKIPPEGRDRPFPWRCFECKAKEVYRQATDYTSTRIYEGKVYTIRIPDLMLPTCRKCGAQTFAVGDDDRIFEGLRAQAGLLTPQEISEQRSRLHMTQEQLAEFLGVPAETIAHWESGEVIQARAMDNWLRQRFKANVVPETRAVEIAK